MLEVQLKHDALFIVNVYQYNQYEINTNDDGEFPK